MDGPSESRSSSFSKLAGAQVPDWAPGDLSRWSIEAFVARDAPQNVTSSGAIRLFGTGVAGSSARLDAVGAICSEFQRLVVAVAASIEGVRTPRGRISEALQRRARLSLQASPAPGSVILNLAPEIETESDSSHRPEPDLLGQRRALVDQSVESILEILAVSKVRDDVGSSLEQVLTAWGPRASGALAGLSSALATNEFDADMTWAEPSAMRRSITIEASEARWINTFVSTRKLDEAPLELTGRLRTVSNRRALELDVEGEIFTLKRGDVSNELLARFRVDDEVRVTVSEKVEYKVGGGESRSHTLRAITKTET